MKFYISFLLLLSATLACFARQTMVSSASEIKNGFWFPGDTIVMTNGTWVNQQIIFKAEGTESEPIVLMAETPGEVILTGWSKLAFSGKYIKVTGLYFKDGNLGSSDLISFRSSSSSMAENCRLTNTSIVSSNPADNTRDTKWVSLYGENNRVDHCSFIDKNNSGTLLVVWLETGIVPNHTIDSNYFGKRDANLDSNGKELNGQEIIRIGDSSHSLQDAGVVVSNNFFEHCNGEIEVISNKSCENIYRNNVFYECVGMLTIRHGNRCVVDGNYFFGNNIDATGGVRIIGEDHKVYNNYFENLRGDKWRAALCIVRGGPDEPLNGYAPVKNAEVAFNTMVNCKQAFSVSYNSSSSKNVPPVGTTIAHNNVYSTTSSNKDAQVYPTNVAAMDVTWKNNLMYQGEFWGVTFTEAEAKAGVDPSLEQVSTSIPMFEPNAGSALGDYSSDEFTDVTADIRGRERGTAKIPGASQISGTVSLEMPDRTNTGVDFEVPTSIDKVFDSNVSELNAYVAHNEIKINVTESGTLRVLDISGRVLFQQGLEIGQNTASYYEQGILILSFVGENGIHATRKVLCL